MAHTSGRPRSRDALASPPVAGRGGDALRFRARRGTPWAPGPDALFLSGPVCPTAPVEGPDPSRLLVFQDPILFPRRTVRGHVAPGLEARRVGRDRASRTTGPPVSRMSPIPTRTRSRGHSAAGCVGPRPGQRNAPDPARRTPGQARHPHTAGDAGGDPAPVAGATIHRPARHPRRRGGPGARRARDRALRPPGGDPRRPGAVALSAPPGRRGTGAAAPEILGSPGQPT